MLSKNDIILFKGTYDIKDGNVSGSVAAFPVEIDANPGGSNVMSVSYYYFYLKNSPTKYKSETYNLASFASDGTKIGEISWQAIYPQHTGQAGRTNPDVQKYIVNGKSAIYIKTCDVIIDFTGDVRVISFIGRKCPHSGGSDKK